MTDPDYSNNKGKCKHENYKVIGVFKEYITDIVIIQCRECKEMFRA